MQKLKIYNGISVDIIKHKIIRKWFEYYYILEEVILLFYTFRMLCYQCELFYIDPWEYLYQKIEKNLLRI